MRLGLLTLMSCLVWEPESGWAQSGLSTSRVRPAEVEAAYLFNFAKYVEWPAGAFLNKQAPLLIGVLGRDPFGPLLEQTVADRTIDSRKVLVRRSNDPRELRDCHLLFIGSSERDRLPAVFHQLRGSWALTVGEMPRFLDNGMVVFVLDNGVVRFDVSLENVKRGRLNLSARMLASARNVLRKSPSL